MDSLNCIVIDHGSNTIKAGFAGDDSPSLEIASSLCRNKHKPRDNSVPSNINYPIERGYIKNWNDLEQLWTYTFNKLKINPTEYKFLLTETPFCPKKDLEKTAELIFETYNVPSVYSTIPAVLSLYASGRTTGAMIDCGHGLTQVTAIFNDHGLPGSTLRFDLGGQDLNEYLRKIIINNGFSYFNSIDKNIIGEMKEQVCYVALNYKKEASNSYLTNKYYELPDGKLINFIKERYECPEALFNPKLINMESAGIHELLNNVIVKASKEMRKDLFSNVVISGGSSSFPGFGERLKKELDSIQPYNLITTSKVKIISENNRKYSAWIGGSFIGSMSVYDNFCLTKEDYKDYGPSIVHKKFMFK